MKSIITSVSPYLCEKIMSGDCKILVKKSTPKEVPFKAYIYCTRIIDKKHCSDEFDIGIWKGNEHIIGEFICDKVEMVNAKCSDYGIDLFYHDCLTNGCLTEREIEEYFNIPEDKDLRVMKGNGYAWHISDLKIYDEPKELSEFYRPCSYSGICYSCNRFRPNGTPNDKPNDFCDGEITRPPQSYMYVEKIETI